MKPWATYAAATALSFGALIAVIFVLDGLAYVAASILILVVYVLLMWQLVVATWHRAIAGRRSDSAGSGSG